MGLIPPQLQALVGVWSEPELACDPVEQGAVRRHAQAIMDEDPAYAPGGIAPPLFPVTMLRRRLGTPDLVQEKAHDPDFDGVVPGAGLPPLAGLAHLPVLNGGSEFEFFRHARQGERVAVRQRYAEITQKATRNGPLVVVVIESEYATGTGELLMRSCRTLLRRLT